MPHGVLAPSCSLPARDGGHPRRGRCGGPWLVGLRTALLDGALASVRPGGVVAYVTCSPHTDETVAVVDAAAARADVEVLPVAPLFPEVPGLARGGHGQLWPHRHGTDAMFMALLRRTR